MLSPTVVVLGFFMICLNAFECDQHSALSAMEHCLDYYSPSIAIQTLSAARMGDHPQQYSQLQLSIEAAADVVLTAHCISMDINLNSDEFILTYLIKQWLLKKDPFPARHSQSDPITFDDNAATASSSSLQSVPVDIVFDDACKFHPNLTNLIVLLFNTNVNSYRIEHECGSAETETDTDAMVVYDQLYDIDDDDDNCSSLHNSSDLLPFRAQTSWKLAIDTHIMYKKVDTESSSNSLQLNIYELLLILAAFVVANLLCCVVFVFRHQNKLNGNMQSMRRNIQRLETLSMAHNNNSWTSPSSKTMSKTQSKTLGRNVVVSDSKIDRDSCTYKITTAQFISTKDTFSGSPAAPPRVHAHVHVDGDHEPEPSPCYIPIERHSPLQHHSDGTAGRGPRMVPTLAVVVSNPRQANAHAHSQPAAADISGRVSAVWTSARDLKYASRSCSYGDEQDELLSRQISSQDEVAAHSLCESHVRVDEEEEDDSSSIDIVTDGSTNDDDDEVVSSCRFNFADDDNRTVTDMTLCATSSQEEKASYGCNPFACAYNVSQSAPQRSVSRDWDGHASTLSTISPAANRERSPFRFKSPVDSPITQLTPNSKYRFSDDESGVLTSSRVSSATVTVRQHHKRANTTVVTASSHKSAMHSHRMSECDTLTLSSSVRLPAYHPQRVKVMSSDRHIPMCQELVCNKTYKHSE